MRSSYNLERIAFARRYAEKHIEGSSGKALALEIVQELCDEAEKLWKDNAALRDQLFQIDQEQDINKQWETILAAKLDRAIRENDGKDYLEIRNSINNDIFTITIQKKFGQTPEQLRRSSDIRRLKAAKKIVNLLKDNKQMQQKLVDQGNEIRVLKTLNKGDWDEIKSRQDILLAINAINNLIRQWNQEHYKHEFSKISGSMRESYHEAWSRAADLSWSNIELLKQLKVLRVELNRKNVEKSKFAKYRKRERNVRKVVARRRALA